MTIFSRFNRQSLLRNPKVFCQRSLRERNMKLLLETVMCIMHCRKYHLLPHHNCNRDSHLRIIIIKIVIHIFAAETVTSICAAETFNCIIATETVTCIIATERSTKIATSNRKYYLKSCKNATGVVTCIIAIESVSLHSSNRLQKLSLAEMVPVRACFSYYKRNPCIT